VQAPHGGASLVVTDSRDDGQDRIVWKWMSSTATDKLDLGAPLSTTAYGLCVYEMGAAPALKLEATAPAGGLCAGQPCWKETSAGFKYQDRVLTPDGVAMIELKAGPTPGKSTIRVKGKGPRLGLPPSFVSPLSVQLRKKRRGGMLGGDLQQDRPVGKHAQGEDRLIGTCWMRRRASNLGRSRPRPVLRHGEEPMWEAS